MDEPFKNCDGTFKHFEVKGGPFEGWRKQLHEMQCRAERSADVFQEMDSNDINGTALAPGVLDDLSTRLDKLLTEMEKYRLEVFTK